jgi:hypothetical protein
MISYAMASSQLSKTKKLDLFDQALTYYLSSEFVENLLRVICARLQYELRRDGAMSEPKHAVPRLHGLHVARGWNGSNVRAQVCNGHLPIAGLSPPEVPGGQARELAVYRRLQGNRRCHSQQQSSPGSDDRPLL